MYSSDKYISTIQKEVLGGILPICLLQLIVSYLPTLGNKTMEQRDELVAHIIRAIDELTPGKQLKKAPNFEKIFQTS
jgi:hypothetical protein